jgi:serine/threonine protein kinase
MKEHDSSNSDKQETRKKRSKSSVQYPDYLKTPPPAPPSVDQQLSAKKRSIDMYDIGQELGSGAFSVVKSAQHKVTKELYAVKILDKYEDDDEQTQKFKQEIAIISSLHHENIVRFYELDSDNENYYVIMELVGGGELFDYIIDSKRIPELESVCIVAQVLKAIEYMHKIGTAHRDLKPENLLFKNSDKKIIKIADFGESKSFTEGSLTTYCGTPDYMAPEIIRGDPYGSAVDLWSIGVITYVMVAGFPPFDGENDVEVFASILSIRYSFPSPEWDTISSSAKHFISSLLKDSPKDRLTASEALEHPWIVNNTPPELRINDKPEKPEAVEKDLSKKAQKRRDQSKSSKTEIVVTTSGTLSDSGTWKGKKSDEDIFDPNKHANPKKFLLDELEQIQVTGEHVHYNGEIKTMAEVVESTPGKKPLSDVEKSIYEIYHKRLLEIRFIIKGSKKKKKT